MLLLIVGVILTAVVTGLGFLSYKHFESFEKIAYTLLFVSFGIQFIVILWNTAVYNIADETRTDINNSKIDLGAVDYKEIANELKLNILKSDLADKAYNTVISYKFDSMSILLYSILLWIVLLFLLRTPFFIKDHPHNTKQKKEN